MIFWQECYIILAINAVIFFQHTLVYDNESTVSEIWSCTVSTRSIGPSLVHQNLQQRKRDPNSVLSCDIFYIRLAKTMCDHLCATLVNHHVIIFNVALENHFVCEVLQLNYVIIICLSYWKMIMWYFLYTLTTHCCKFMASKCMLCSSLAGYHDISINKQSLKGISGSKMEVGWSVTHVCVREGAELLFVDRLRWNLGHMINIKYTCFRHNFCAAHFTVHRVTCPWTHCEWQEHLIDPL